MRVLSGKLRGARWIVGSEVHGCWLGTYEREHQKLAAQLTEPGGVVFDLGANVGFFTLLFSRLVGSGAVIAFEPLPRNLGYLHAHLELNGASNVRVMECAVGEHRGRSLLASRRGPSQAALALDGDLEVTVVSIDSVVMSGEVAPPNLIKMDIQGGELSALRGATNTLSSYQPALWIETHGSRIHSSCKELLTALGYRVSREVTTDLDGWGTLVAHSRKGTGRSL